MTPTAPTAKTGTLLISPSLLIVLKMFERKPETTPLNTGEPLRDILPDDYQAALGPDFSGFLRKKSFKAMIKDINENAPYRLTGALLPIDDNDHLRSDMAISFTAVSGEDPHTLSITFGEEI